MNAPVTLSLDARYYTDPAIFAKEMDGLLSTTWQFAGHANDIPKVGDYFAFEIAGQQLFSIRGRDKQVRTFYNVCQHRAHGLVQGSGNARVVVCPYHAWTYELTGHLRNGPNIGSVPGFDKSTVCLTEVRTEDFNGFIFVNLDDDAAPMDEWFPGVREEIAEYVPNVQELAPLECVEIPEKCNWKVSVENYSECYHCPINHQTFATGVIKPGSVLISMGHGQIDRIGHLFHALTLSRVAQGVPPVHGLN
ncbi:MAG: aromatic ring-hydroxylating dioxygenase subunit alpha, partial [Pseudomonadota bacterium]